MNNKWFHIFGIVFVAILSYFLGKPLFIDVLISVEGNKLAIILLWVIVILYYLAIIMVLLNVLFRKEVKKK